MQLIFCLVLIIVIFKSLDCQDDDNLVNQKMLLNSRLNYFDTDLLRYAAEDRPGNIMLSPASIKSVLAMLLEGSSGETEMEIRSALRLSPDKNDFRDQLNAYLSTLQANSPGTQLANANAVFVSDKLSKQIRKDYENNLRNVYLSEIAKVSFLQPALSANIINSWVGRKTKGLIPNLMDPASVNPSTDIMVINALYFKSAWSKAFYDDTKTACFYNRGVCSNVAMMNLYAELNYAFVENLRAHAVELPYVGGRYSMVVLVPQDRDGHHTLIRDLPYMSLPQISGLMQMTEVELSLPRFTVDYNEDLVPILKKMRINTVFTKASNLSGIFQGKQSAFVNNLFHRVHVDVNEKGTIAAAATGAVVIPLISNGAQLIVDRPFVFFIRDNQLGLVLFEGKIEEPTRWEESGLVGRKPLGPNRKQVVG